MSSLVSMGYVVAIGDATEDSENFVVNGTVYPKSVMQDAFLVDANPPQGGNGWMYKDGTFSPIPSPEPVVEVDEDMAASVRAERNAKLAASDWTQTLDAGSRCDQAAWATYRQQLCDLTKQPGFPGNIVWPINPFGVA